MRRRRGTALDESLERSSLPRSERDFARSMIYTFVFGVGVS